MNAKFFHRGSALLIVLWAVAMMAMTVLGVVEYVHYDLEETASLKKEFRVRQLAESGVAIGLHPLEKRGDSLLVHTFGPGESFEVYLRSEGGRININTIVQSGQWKTLHDLCTVWGIRETDAVNIVKDFETWTKLVKWQELVSGQNAVTGSARPALIPGFAIAGQTGTAVRHKFESVEEMLLIPGMKLLADAKPDWRNFFTIWSDGKLDMNEAPADLISAVCGVGEVQALRFVNARLGPDGKPDTLDDVNFQDMEQIRQALGMSKDDFEKIQGQISLQDSVTRIESNGILGNYQRKIMVVVRRNSSPPVYLQWQEL